MTQTTHPQPIPQPSHPTVDNDAMEWINPGPQRREPGMFESWREATKTVFALGVVALGVLAAALLLCWLFFEVAGQLGLLS